MNLFFRRPCAPPRVHDTLYTPYPGQMWGRADLANPGPWPAELASPTPWPAGGVVTVMVRDVRDGWVFYSVLGGLDGPEQCTLQEFNFRYRRFPSMNQRIRDYIERDFRTYMADTSAGPKREYSYRTIESAFATVEGFRSWVGEQYPDLPAVGLTFDDVAALAVLWPVAAPPEGEA